MPSGKQVLLHFLNKYSLALQADEDLSEVSEDLRVAFLLHGSTPPDMWTHVDNIEWGSERYDDHDVEVYGANKNDVYRQGLKIKGKDIMLSDLFEVITWEDEKIPEDVAERFPDLTIGEYKSAIHIMWLLFKGLEYNATLAKVENNGQLDMEQVGRWLISYRKKMKLFREGPDDFF